MTGSRAGQKQIDALDKNYNNFEEILRSLKDISKDKKHAEYVRYQVAGYGKKEDDFQKFLQDFKGIVKSDSEEWKDFTTAMKQPWTHPLYAEYLDKFNQRERLIKTMQALHDGSMNPLETRELISSQKYKEWMDEYVDLSELLDELKSKMGILPGKHI